MSAHHETRGGNVALGPGRAVILSGRQVGSGAPGPKETRGVPPPRGPRPKTCPGQGHPMRRASANEAREGVSSLSLLPRWPAAD